MMYTGPNLKRIEMKDIVITSRRIRTELIILAVCFLISCCLNVYAIIAYGGEWSELFTSIGFVSTFTAITYLMLMVFRIAIRLLSNLKK